MSLTDFNRTIGRYRKFIMAIHITIFIILVSITYINITTDYIRPDIYSLRITGVILIACNYFVVMKMVGKFTDYARNLINKKE